MTTNLAKVQLTSVTEEFQNHISPDFNKRIIFTGKFGVGKTTFLHDFFSKQDVNTFWLSPIKYSVGANEDIFEYIKFDLILEIFTNHLVVPAKESIPESLFIWSYLNHNTSELLTSFFELVSLLSPDGEKAIKLLNIFNNSYTSYKNYKKELLEKNKSEPEIFKDYLTISTQRIGSIMENDFITQSIRVYLESLKEVKEKGSSNVLIIDDFDRLDPEHIFRILNILSVHNDYLSGTFENKFGFDKIIIVCDIDSIENFYHHKYGKESNFSGYIDKFCSTKFFRFSNFDAIKHFCEENIRINDLPKYCEDTLLMILLYLIRKEKITLRNLLKYRYESEKNTFIISENLSMDMTDYCKNCCFIETDSFCIDTTSFPFIHAIAILSNIFGDFNKLKQCIRDLSKEESIETMSSDFVEPMINSLCLLSHISKDDSNVKKLCFNMDTSRHDGQHIKMPQTLFCGSTVTIKLPWSKHNKYKGDGNYFDNSEIEVSRLTDQAKSFGNMFAEFSIILDYLDKKNFKNRI